jgi:hypothetical protein
MVGRILAVLAFFIAASAGVQGTTQTVVLTLSRESGYPSGFCRLDVSASLNGGEARLFCGPLAEGARDNGRTQTRRITADESEELRQLYDAARLFDDGHKGLDLTANDGPFEVLVVRGGPAVVLVTSANPTFQSGPRKELLDWLQRLVFALRKGMVMTTNSSSLLSLVPFFTVSTILGVVAFRLAREKGRNVPLWTILGVLPLVNFACMCFFIGAANLRLERKIDELLESRSGR